MPQKQRHCLLVIRIPAPNLSSITPEGVIGLVGRHGLCCMESNLDKLRVELFDTDAGIDEELTIDKSKKWRDVDLRRESY